MHRTKNPFFLLFPVKYKKKLFKQVNYFNDSLFFPVQYKKLVQLLPLKLKFILSVLDNPENQIHVNVNPHFKIFPNFCTGRPSKIVWISWFVTQYTSSIYSSIKNKIQYFKQLFFMFFIMRFDYSLTSDSSSVIQSSWSN